MAKEELITSNSGISRRSKKDISIRNISEDLINVFVNMGLKEDVTSLVNTLCKADKQRLYEKIIDQKKDYELRDGKNDDLELIIKDFGIRTRYSLLNDGTKLAITKLDRSSNVFTTEVRDFATHNNKLMVRSTKIDFINNYYKNEVSLYGSIYYYDTDVVYYSEEEIRNEIINVDVHNTPDFIINEKINSIEIETRYKLSDIIALYSDDLVEMMQGNEIQKDMITKSMMALSNPLYSESNIKNEI